MGGNTTEGHPNEHLRSAFNVVAVGINIRLIPTHLLLPPSPSQTTILIYIFSPTWHHATPDIAISHPSGESCSGPADHLFLRKAPACNITYFELSRLYTYIPSQPLSESCSGPSTVSSFDRHQSAVLHRARNRRRVLCLQVFLVLLFWIARISEENRDGPRLLFLRRLNRALSRFTPWQIIISTLTLIYAVKHSDALLGLHAPEPLARLYSRNYYRSVQVTARCSLVTPASSCP